MNWSVSVAHARVSVYFIKVSLLIRVELLTRAVKIIAGHVLPTTNYFIMGSFRKIIPGM